jgi:hypothetical protein
MLIHEKSGKKRGGNFDRINRMKRIKSIKKNIISYPVNPVNPLNPVKRKSLTPHKNISRDRFVRKTRSFDLTIDRTPPFSVSRLLIECHPHLSAKTQNKRTGKWTRV